MTKSDRENRWNGTALHSRYIRKVKEMETYSWN